MDGIPEGEGEAMDWELLLNNDHDEAAAASASASMTANELGPPLDSCALIRPDYFSIHPPTPLTSNSSSSSSSSTDVDRNFDDSYLANQLFPFLNSHQHQHQSSSSTSAASSNNLPLSHDSDSDSDSKAMIVLPHTTTTEDFLLDAQAPAAPATGGGTLDANEDEEEEEDEHKEEEEERSAVWWKVPMEVLKYWVVRVSPIPVWSLSVAAAAAFLGLVILGRRLYKMKKRKTQTLKLNVALDDKKVSQLMGRVARLNEAFSVVRRVPIVRPSLPAPSVTLRPVMSIR